MNMLILRVSDSSSARLRQWAWKSRSEVVYMPSQPVPMPLPCIIWLVSPSRAIGVQIAGPWRWAGIETSSTVAPSRLNVSAPARTLASTSASDAGWPKPSFTTAMRSPPAPRPTAP